MYEGIAQTVKKKGRKEREEDRKRGLREIKEIREKERKEKRRKKRVCRIDMFVTVEPKNRFDQRVAIEKEKGQESDGAEMQWATGKGNQPRKKNKRPAGAMSQGKEETKRERDWEFNRKGLRRTKNGERTWTLVPANIHPAQYKIKQNEKNVRLSQL